MFHVAICDDNSIFTSTFEKQLQIILEKDNIEFSIDCFSNINELIQETQNGTIFQLLFLDIEFPNDTVNGINGADFIRTHLSESNMHIVFISSQPKYAIQLFDFQPLQFLIKPINQDKLEKTITLSLKSWNSNRQVVRFLSNRKEINIEIQQILYIESFGRKKILHCSSGNTYTINDSFTNILQKLQPYDFFSPHKSYIANYHKIIIWRKENITMSNNDIIPISRTHMKAVQDLQLKHHLN